MTFERAVITQNSETAAILVENKFHTDNECVVMSQDGYPFDRPDEVRTLIRKNPETKIAVVHDASVAGCALPVKLRQEPWFPEESMVVVDAGLRPRDAIAYRLATSQGARQVVDPALAAVLRPKDVAGLEEGRSAEIATLTPKVLMAGLRRVFARAAVGGPDDTGFGGSHIWYYGDGDGDGLGDGEDTFG